MQTDTPARSTGGVFPARNRPRSIDRLASDVDGRLVVPAATGRESRARTPWGRLRPGWPIGLLVAGAPLWWAFGISALMLPILAIPLARQLQKRQVKVPPGFWIWVLFLLWVAVSILMMNYQVPNTASSEGIGRYIAFGVRLCQYIGATVILLWVGNATERELSRTRVIRWIGWLALIAIALGLTSVALPTWGFPTVASHVLPGFLVQGDGIAHLAQVQDVLGDASPRPAAPFEYTNEWGSVLSMCLVWIVVGWGVLGSLGRRVLLCCVLGIATVPIVYSLNRAMWLGLLVAGMYVVVRLAMRGRLLMGFVSLLAAAVAATVFVVSPLGSLIGERFENPHSNDVRASLADAAWNAAEASPIIGAGSTRNTIGSESSIAIGPRPDCPRCGYRVIGSTGQFWMLLIAQGFVGAGLYMAFLIRTIWSGRHDASPLGIAATTVLVLQLLYAFFYGALAMPLTITMLGAALLWRNREVRAAATTSTTDSPGPPSGASSTQTIGPP